MRMEEKQPSNLGWQVANCSSFDRENELNEHIFYFLTELSIVSNLTDLLIYADDLAIYIKN